MCHQWLAFSAGTRGARMWTFIVMTLMNSQRGLRWSYYRCVHGDAFFFSNDVATWARCFSVLHQVLLLRFWFGHAGGVAGVVPTWNHVLVALLQWSAEVEWWNVEVMKDGGAMSLILTSAASTNVKISKK